MKKSNTKMTVSDYLYDEHGLILLESEVNEIIELARALLKKEKRA